MRPAASNDKRCSEPKQLEPYGYGVTDGYCHEYHTYHYLRIFLQLVLRSVLVMYCVVAGAITPTVTEVVCGGGAADAAAAD